MKPISASFLLAAALAACNSTYEQRAAWRVQQEPQAIAALPAGTDPAIVNRLHREVDTGVLHDRDVPGTGDPVRQRTGGPGADQIGTHEGGLDRSLGTEVGPGLREGHRSFLADAEVVGIEDAVNQRVVVTTGAVVHREGVVRVACVADLDADRVLGLACGLQRQAGLRHRLDGGRRLRREVGVAEQDDVLHGDRHRVDLPVDGPAVDRGLHELVGVAAEIHRRDQARARELADPVVGAEQDVRSLPCRRLLDELAPDVVELDLGDLDRHTVLLTPLLGEVADGPGALLVGPDLQCGAAADVARPAVVAPAARGQAQGDDCPERQALANTSHMPFLSVR